MQSYKTLQSTLEKVCTSDMIIVKGDFNAKAGRERSIFKVYWEVWDRSKKQVVRTEPGADCSPDHQLLIANMTREEKESSCKYNLQEIPERYTVKCTKGFFI